MTYKKIEIIKRHSNAQGTLTEIELDEILSDLNQGKFSRRTPLICGEYEYQDPLDLENTDHCHATARKFSRDNLSLEIVSGYIVKSRANSVELVSHSVVRDINTNILWELMNLIFPVSYDFIERSPDIKGYDLSACS